MPNTTTKQPKRSAATKGAKSQPKPQANTSTPKIPELNAAELRAYVRNPGPDPNPQVIADNVARYRDELVEAKATAQEAKGEEAERERQTVMAMKATIREFEPPCPKCQQGTLERRWGMPRGETTEPGEPEPKKLTFLWCPTCETRFLYGVARECPDCQGTLQHKPDWARRCVTCNALCSDAEATECPTCQEALQHDESQEWIVACVECQAAFTMLSRLGRSARVSVNQNQPRTTEKRPKYVKQIAWQEVDVAVADPANMAVFHKLLAEWAENYVSPSLTDPQPRAPQEVTVAGMAAQLAANHDNVCEDRPKITPADWWPKDKPWPSHTGAYVRLGETPPEKAQLQSYWEQVKAEFPSTAEPDAFGQVPWDPDNPDFLPLSEAIADLADGAIPVKSLGRIVRRADVDMRWMNKGQRSKVHIGDFIGWWKRQPKSDAEIEALLDGVEERKKIERDRPGRPAR